MGFVLGLKERLKRALGQFGESGVGGGEDGERSRAFERADEIGGGEGGGERLKRAGGDGGVDDIGFGGGGRGGDGDDWCESAKEDYGEELGREGTTSHKMGELAELMV